MVISASGYMRRIPAEALSPASREVMLPLKESMAITTFMYTLLLISDGCITCHQAELEQLVPDTINLQ
jgi:hypothetical protein